MNRSKMLKSIELLLTFLMLVSVSADKGYYGNSGSMSDAGDMEVHISMPSQKSNNARCEDISIPMCRGNFLVEFRYRNKFSFSNSQVSVTT